MTFVSVRTRAVVVALVVVVVCGAGLFLGAGGARANSFPCSETEGQDVWVNLAGTYAGVDPGGNATGWVWVCAAPSGGETNQRWTVVTVADPAGSAPGAGVQTSGCTYVVPGPPAGWGPGCTVLLGMTGAEVGTPATSVTTSGSTPGGSIGTGTGTCVYVDGTSTCPSSVTLAGITVNTSDLVPAATPSTPTAPCTGINNTCIPLAVTVRAFQDTANPTLTVQTAATSPTNVEVAPAGTCVQVQASC